MNVNQLIPAKISCPVDELISDEFCSQQCQPAFDTLSRKFLAELSTILTRDHQLRAWPELVALGFWLRDAHLGKIVSDFRNGMHDDLVVVPRGIAFHVTPANVDTIFVYSWVISLLAGNINIVRVSQRRSEQILMLIDRLNRLFAKAKYLALRERNIFLSYGHEQAINQYLSGVADMRVLWGGDATINLLRSQPSKPTAKDITFADKISFAIISAAEFLSADSQQKTELAQAFYNDAYSFDQMACSSPRSVLFIGNSVDCLQASEAFWLMFRRVLEQRGHQDDIAAAMNKLVSVYHRAASSDELIQVSKGRSGDPTVIVHGEGSARQIIEGPGQGFFVEQHLSSLEDVADYCPENAQTMAYFGFDKPVLRKVVVNMGTRSIDRIVPIGSALDFSVNWDGYSLLYEFTKTFSVK